jgi:hypothetical protein
MSVTDFSSELDREVERQFMENPPIYGKPCRNPVTGGGYMGGLDPIEEQKDAARRSLLARNWFAYAGPDDAQPLPISSLERDDINLRDDYARCLFHYILELYSRSLDAQQFDFIRHPHFAAFVSGVLWDAEHDGGHLPNCPDELPQLRKRFPPRRLAGLLPSFYWVPPKEYAEEMDSQRRWKAWNAGNKDAFKGYFQKQSGHVGPEQAQ